MKLFFQLFNADIPIHVYLIAIAIGLIATFGILVWKTERRKSHLIELWIVVCLFLMLYSTVLGREATYNYDVRLMPLWSIGAIESGLIEVRYEKINNVIFFMPLGALSELWFKIRSPKKDKHNLCKAVAFGCVVSVCIEMIQLATRTGICEIDDVICNTLGTAIGAVIVWLI